VLSLLGRLALLARSDLAHMTTARASGYTATVLQIGLWGSKTGHRLLTCGFACGSPAAGSIAGL